MSAGLVQEQVLLRLFFNLWHGAEAAWSTALSHCSELDKLSLFPSVKYSSKGCKIPEAALHVGCLS